MNCIFRANNVLFDFIWLYLECVILNQNLRIYTCAKIPEFGRKKEEREKERGKGR